MPARERSIIAPLLCILGTTIVLSGCATEEPQRPAPVAATRGAAWFVGGWALHGDSCRGDLGILYRSDGTWASQGVSGTWRMHGQSMEIDVLPSVRGSRAGAKPLHYVDRIEVAGPNEYVAHRDGAPTRRLLRCHPAPK